jgi:chorismate-pyruvate lyase
LAFLKQLGDFDASGLGVVQRVLLVTDGTLTDTVEAIFGEPIGLRKLAVNISTAGSDPAPLEVTPGESVMHRKILLYGESTQQNYVYAESSLALNRLPPGFREGLLSTDIPLGRLWSQYRIETWKELLFAGLVSIEPLQDYFPAGNGGLVKRTYRMISHGAPLMVITECFPREYGT